MLYSFLVVVDTLLAIAVIVLILLNRGRGAEIGAAFGGGASGSMFGAKGAAPFITKVIAVLAALFLVNSLGLAYLANFQYVQTSVVDQVDIEELLPEEEEDGFGEDVPAPAGDEAGEDDSFGEPGGVVPDVPN